MRSLALVLCFALGGCVVSVQPVVTAAGSSFDARLVGSWAAADGKDRIVVSAGDDKVYAIEYTDSDGKVGHFQARLGHLGRRTVLDVQPAPRDSSPMPEGPLMIRGHLLFVVAVAGDTAKLEQLDPKALHAAIKSGAIAMARFDDHDQLVLTGATAELQRVLAAYIERKGALDDPSTWVRVR
ncbi:MAG TPA: hypothetical protein VF483_08170 [Gemmatimonadaceae bacterium]